MSQWLFWDPTERFIVVRGRGDTTAILDVERREVFGEAPVPGLGIVVFDGTEVIVGSSDKVFRIPLDPLAAARRAQPRPLTPMELGVFDVGNAEQRAALFDRYVAWTYAAHRIVGVALGAAAEGETDRVAAHLQRLAEIDPDGPERFVVQAALHAGAVEHAAAIAALESALDAGCNPRYLRHRIFDELRETPSWKAVADRRAR